MDALKLFYDTKFGPVQRQAPERGTNAAPRTSEAPNAADSLLRRVEAHAGQPLRSDAAIDAYFKSLQRAEKSASRPAGRSLLRETMLVLFLLIAVLQYYYMDVALQISTLNRVTVFVPTEESPTLNDRS
jgi:hypothetical protein